MANWRGTWASGTAYGAGDSVSYGGVSYYCVTANTGHAPGSDGDWALIDSFTGPGTADAIDGVTVSGTPSAGQVVTATSGTAAHWQAPAGAGETGCVYVNAYGADPAGAADSTAAFLAAQAAGGSGAYQLVLGAGTYKLGTSADLGAFGRNQGMTGQGSAVTKINYVGSATCVAAYDSSFSSSLSSGGQFGGLAISGASAGPGAIGMSWGNLNKARCRDIAISGFAGTGLKLANGSGWSEQAEWTAVKLVSNAVNVLFDTGSFDYSVYQFVIIADSGEDGLRLQNGATLEGVRLEVRGNFSAGAGNTAAVIAIDRGNSAGTSRIDAAQMFVNAECDGSSGTGHITVLMNGSSSSELTGAGVLNFIAAGSVPFAGASITPGAPIFGFSGVVSDPVLGTMISGDALAAHGGTQRAVSGSLTSGGSSGDIYLTLADTFATQLASGNTAITFHGIPDKRARTIDILIAQPSSGAAGTVTWPGSVKWARGAAPALSTANSAVDHVRLVYVPASSSWYGEILSGLVTAGQEPGWKILTDPAYGGIADGRTVQDAVTNGTTTITSATAAFTSADIGKLALITGSADADGANAFAAAIASVTNATTAVLASAPSFSVTAANLTVGTDNKNAVNSWLADAAGGRGHVPAGIYLSSGQHTFPGSSVISGDGYGYANVTVNHPPQRGSVLAFAGSGAPAYFVQLGADNSGSPGHTNPVIDSLAIDGSGLCSAAVLATATRAVIRNCQVWRGSAEALALAGGGPWVISSVLGQQNLGDVILSTAADTHILNCVQRQPGSGGACVHLVNVEDFLYAGNHCWSGGNGAVSSAYPCNNIWAVNNVSGTQADNYCITGNLFDGVYGHAIQLTSSGGGSCRISDVNISGNTFFAVSGFPDATFSVVYCDTQASSNIRGLNVTGNTARGSEGTTNSWVAMVTKSGGAGALTQVTVSGNTGMGVRAPWSGFRPDGGRHGNVFTATCTSATSIASSNDGTATFSGTGSATTFTITHGLAAAPTTVNLTAASAAAAAPFWWSSTSTTITVTYLTAPASGTNNVVLSWEAVA